MRKKKERKKDRTPIRGTENKKEQIGREATVTLWLFAGYLVLWLMLGYGHAADDRYILGLPSWFFWGGLMGFLLFAFLAVLTVKTVFRDFDTEEEE